MIVRLKPISAASWRPAHLRGRRRRSRAQRRTQRRAAAARDQTSGQREARATDRATDRDAQPKLAAGCVERAVVAREPAGADSAHAAAGPEAGGEPARVPHKQRPRLQREFPVHVTTRLRPGLRNLRSKPELRVLERALEAGAERFGMRVIEHSVLANRLQLAVEAEGNHSLSRGMQGLLVRIAKALNKLWRRRGSVFADRYHMRIASTPRAVRNMLIYVLQSARWDGLPLRGRDPCSSGWWFRGWSEHAARAGPKVWSLVPAARIRLPRARTELLREGWKFKGWLGLRELPSLG